ncbi:MAG: alanine--glyoxylate aminotransferase [Dehalococcoidia bacterium]|nr:alanine--glyoxylate aminotransferase [Dehalococcoidia bacterium]
MNQTYLEEFKNPERILLGAGPSSVHPRVLQAMTKPVIGHLDPDFFQVMDEVGEMLRNVFHTNNFMTAPLSSTGTGAMEAACVNILEDGDKVIICRNGYFGDRLSDIARRSGAETIILDAPWGKPIDINALEHELKKHENVKMVGVVHAETSTGVLTPLTEIIELVHSHNALVLVDAVTSLGGHDFRMDDWDIDIAYSASQKCLGSPPGLAPITIGPRAEEVINNRTSDVQSFYFNLKDLETYWSQTRAYHHTSPISMTYALRESLRMMMEEGLENRINRHAKVASALRAGVSAIGLDILSDEEYRLNPLTPVCVPDGIDEADVRRQLLQDYNIEVSGALGELRGKVWRVGLMGESARETNVFAFLSAMESILSKSGYEVAYGASLAAAQRALITFDE